MKRTGEKARGRTRCCRYTAPVLGALVLGATSSTGPPVLEGSRDPTHHVREGSLYPVLWVGVELGPLDPALGHTAPSRGLARAWGECLEGAREPTPSRSQGITRSYPSRSGGIARSRVVGRGWCGVGAAGSSFGPHGPNPRSSWNAGERRGPPPPWRRTASSHDPAKAPERDAARFPFTPNDPNP